MLVIWIKNVPIAAELQMWKVDEKVYLSVLLNKKQKTSTV
jgi:hypothetical protein